MTGTTLGHYRILAKLGEGGMGEVYAAEDTKLQRRVALKLLPSDMAADPQRLQRFQREARAIAALNHPNVVTIYSVEEADGVQFLTMELVEGKTLGELIPPDGLPLEELLRLALPLVDAVAAAHQHGIVHRDLKPANVMLASDGRVKVLDFGLAKLKPDVSTTATTTTRLETHSLTSAHAIVGTAAYMSPEQAEGRPLDYRTDIFSLGVVLYEMASGRRPFGGDTVFSVISSIIKDTPARLSDVKRSVPVALDRIVAKALAKDPAERYQSAQDLRNAVQDVQPQTTAGRIVRGIVLMVVRSRGARRMALAAGLVASVAGGGWYLWAGRGGAGPGTQPVALRFRTDRLTTDAGVEQFPSLTPDGKWIVYSGQAEGNREIYLLSTSGQIPNNLTKDPADDDEPAVSRDGEWIAFRSSRDGGGIFVMRLTGEGVRRVTPMGVSVAFNPSWSPDGTEIAYTSENVQLTPLSWEGRSELWVIDVKTSERRSLEVGDGVQPNWSPNGHRIAYVARVKQAGSGNRADARLMDVFTVPVRGGEPVAATNDPFNDWCPVWSPDGQYLYFVSDRGGRMNLWRVPIDEASGKKLGDPEPVTTGVPFLAHPSISADGQRIAYVEKVETANIQKITLDPTAAKVQGEPTWITTSSQGWLNPDPTKDGEWLVFASRDQPVGDLYKIRPDGTGLQQLTKEPNFVDRMPHWSPDKNWIAFFSNRSGPLAVWKIRSDGSGVQQVADAPSTYPVWSPDGALMAVSSTREVAGGEERFTLLVDPNREPKAQTPVELPLPDRGLRPFSAQDWSPDRRKLAGQIGAVGSAKGIVIYTFASRSYERLTDFGEWPVWLPDSRRVLFVTGGKEFWVVDARTKEKHPIFRVTRDVLNPARLTGDGRAAFFALRVTAADIYLLTFEK